VAKLVFKTIDVGAVAAGATVEGYWTSNDDYTIKKIIAVEKSHSPLANVVATLSIDDDVFTVDKLPLSVFQGNITEVPELNYSLRRGARFKYAVQNSGTASIDLFIVLVLETAG